MDIHSMGTRLAKHRMHHRPHPPRPTSSYAYGYSTSVARDWSSIGRSEVTLRRRVVLGPSLLPSSVGRSQEQSASLESVMVERENVVMEGENRSHGGEDDRPDIVDRFSQVVFTIMFSLFIAST